MCLKSILIILSVITSVTFQTNINDLNEELSEDRITSKEFSDFPEKPLQLVRPDVDHKRLVIVEENVKLLQRIVGPVATVAVVGKFHSGKSFLMNQLMGKSNGFGIGPDVRPKTMGIWIWGKPTQFTLESGLKVWILFLDTEGFAANNVTENYDAKIFAVSTLLSSHLLYNSVKIIDQSDIDYLELLARRTQLFALRSQMSRKKWTNDFNKDLLSFPPLIWVVQDFVQSTAGETPKQWLHRLMDSHSRENILYEISLKDVFKSVDCHTLFLPATKRHLLTDLSLAKDTDLTEEYISERKELIRKLKKEIVPKEKNNRPISGVELAALLVILVNAANDGSLADVPNRWDAFVLRLQQTAVEDCLKFYAAEMDVLIVDEYKSDAINLDKLDEWHNSSLSRTVQLLKQLLHGLDDALSTGLNNLEYNINNQFERSRDINVKKIKLKCSQIQHELELSAEETLRKISLPILTSELMQKAKEIFKSIKSQFINKIENLVDNSVIESHLETLTKTIKNQVSTVQLNNNQAIESFLDSKSQESLDKFLSLTSSDYSRLKPRKPSLLKRVLEEGNKQSIQLFNEKCTKFTVENVFEPKYAVLKLQLTEKMKQIENENEKIADTFIQNESNRLIDEFREKTNSKHILLPINNTDMESRLMSEIRKIITDFNDILSDFKIYQSFETHLEKFKENLGIVCDQRRSENVKAFTKEVEIPLQTAKKIIILSQDRYSTVFSFKQFMRSVCLLNLDEGKPKYWSIQLKSDIINQFINEDKQLSKLVQLKSGLWSSIVGFFQWILWLLSFG